MNWEAGDIHETAHKRVKRLVSKSDFDSIMERLKGREELIEREIKRTVYKIRYALQEDADSSEPMWQEVKIRREARANQLVDKLRNAGALCEGPTKTEIVLEVKEVD